MRVFEITYVTTSKMISLLCKQAFGMLEPLVMVMGLQFQQLIHWRYKFLAPDKSMDVVAL